MFKVKIDAKETVQGLIKTKGKLKISLFKSLVIATALARRTVIDNIKTGQRKNLGWPPFSSHTISIKSRKGRSLVGLIDSGRMFSSVHENVSKTRLRGEVFPGVAYLMFHEKGTRKMPQRAIFKPVPKQINKNITAIFTLEVARSLHG